MARSINGTMAQSACLARVRHLRHHPRILADGSSSSRLLALAQALTVSHAAADMDRHLDRPRMAHFTLAACIALLERLDVGSSGSFILYRPLDLLAIRKRIQPRPTRRPA